MPSRLSTPPERVQRRPESCRDGARWVVPAAGDGGRVLRRSSRPLSCATCNEALMTSSTPRKKSAARRARPAQPRRRGSARVEEILDAARHVLAQEGYAEFSLRRVARRVNIRLSTLQHYFPSR